MTHDSISRQPMPLLVPQNEQLVACLNESCRALALPTKRRGRPATLSALHLCLGIVLCGLRGFGDEVLSFPRLAYRSDTVPRALHCFAAL